MEIDTGLVLTLVVVAFIAAAINGVAGFGFALVLVASLSLVIEPRPAVIILSLITPVVQTFQLRHHWQFRDVVGRLRPMLVASAIGTIVGANLLLILPGYALAVALGLFALWYVAGSLRSSPMLVAERTGRRIAPGVGLLAGVSNGTLGASGPILGSYLLAIGLAGRQFVFAISLTFMVMSLVRLGTLALLGAYTLPLVLLGVGLALPAWAGQRLGFRLQGMLSAQAFQRVILVALLLASANLLYRGITEAMASL